MPDPPTTGGCDVCGVGSRRSLSATLPYAWLLGLLLGRSSNPRVPPGSSEPAFVIARRVSRGLLRHHHAASAITILSHDSVPAEKCAYRAVGLPPRRLDLRPCCTRFSIPVLLPECRYLSRFLNPASNVAARISAYRMIANLLSPSPEPHKYETFIYADQRISQCLSVAVDMSPPAYAEARAFLLQSAVERGRSAVQSAPPTEASTSEGHAGGAATRRIISSLIDTGPTL